MTISEFDEKYKDKGGIAILREFMDDLFTLEFIGEHFGIDKQRVKQMLLEMFGISYDPRLKRKQKVIDGMLEFAKTHTEEEFREAYEFISKYYYNLAIAEAHVRGIYGNA